MSSNFQRLLNKGLLNTPPKFLKNSDSIQLEILTGSVAYGVSNDTADMDIYGVCIPPLEMMFPHLDGEIPGFSKQNKRFEQFQQHHILNKDEGKEYDITVYNIVKYFKLCMDNNPNMIDSIFVPERCVLYKTRIGDMIRENRHIFLHKGSWHKFKGYAYSQLNKMKNKRQHAKYLHQIEEKYSIPHDLSYVEADSFISGRENNLTKEYTNGLRKLSDGSKGTLQKYLENLNLFDNDPEQSERDVNTRIYSLDPKFAYHVVRLLEEAEQLLIEGDLDLQKNREQLKFIRNANWSEDDIERYFNEKTSQLEEVYTSSKLQYSPDEEKIKELLLNCIEEYHGSVDMSSAVKKQDETQQMVKDLEEIVEKYKR